MKYALNITLLWISVLILSNCATQKKIKYDPSAEHELRSELIGLSGMSKVNDDNYLIVHDTKSFQPTKRDLIPHAKLSLLSFGIKEYPVLQKIVFPSWENNSKTSSDLESICKLSNRDNEYLVIESGSWKKRNGRIFHIKIDFTSHAGSVLNTIKYPLFHDNSNNPDIVGDQYEGCLCLEQDNGNVILVMAERGGSTQYQQGKMRWGILDLKSKHFTFSHPVGYSISAPGNWVDGTKNRDITDLFLNSENQIWASATEENSDYGSLYSVIYKIGTITDDSSNPIRLETPFYIHRESYGIKIEALAAPTSRSAQSIFSIGFDDELLGGGWRSIK